MENFVPCALSSRPFRVASPVLPFPFPASSRAPAFDSSRFLTNLRIPGFARAIADPPTKGRPRLPLAKDFLPKLVFFIPPLPARDGFNAPEPRLSFVVSNAGGDDDDLRRRLGGSWMALGALLRALVLAAAIAGGLPAAARAGRGAGLAVGFYNATCPRAEELVLAEMRDIVRGDRTLGPALLRFMLHDCFVRGCDASIMLVSRNGTGERDAVPSYSLRGYDEIERIKAKLEAECPLTVSCADIIIMAARDAVFLSNGPRYPVETGRRDGMVSTAVDANFDLPPPNSNIVDLKTYFSVKNLGWKDLVVLSGSHTIGRAECLTFAEDRLYNYSGRGVQDPSLNKTYAPELRKACEAGEENDTTAVEMDPASPYTFDLSYYRDVYSNRGLFVSDQALLHDKWTSDYVARMASAASPDEYFADYAAAMTNMGRIDVLTGDSGEIRKVCGAYR